MHLSSASLSSDTSWNQSTLADYWVLLKPRVMTLVVFTGWVGLLRAPDPMHPFWASFALFCIALGAGASGALNMWYERHTDGMMSRTQQRPLPQQRVAAPDALTLGVLLSLASVVFLGLVIGWMPSALLLGTIFFYSVFYTIYLKPHTPYNIVWGGLAGALPPVIGWSCASPITALEPWLLCLIIFLWTPPHFWALALLYQHDYQRAGFPMMPLVKGIPYTLQQMRLYTLCTGLAVGALACLPSTGYCFAIGSTLCSGWFLRCVWHIHPSQPRDLRLFFRNSILYLFIIFIFILIDYYL